MEDNQKRDKKIVKAIIISAILAILAGVGVFFAIRSNKDTVYAFKGQYSAGTTVTSEMLVPVEVDKTIVVGGQKSKLSSKFITKTNIEEILQQPGLDMVATGRNDLSQSLGIPGKKNDPSVLETENFIIRKTLEYGKIPTILCKSKKRFQELYDKGVRCFTLERDDLLLKKAAEKQLDMMKESLK